MLRVRIAPVVFLHLLLGATHRPRSPQGCSMDCK